MAEVGRVQVCDPGGLLPGGFWAAVAVWLERPQVANKRLCGSRIEARRSAALPSAGPERKERDAAGPGPQEGPEPGQGSPERDSNSRPGLGPEHEEGAAAGRGLQEGSPEGDPDSRAGLGPAQGTAGRGREEAQGWRPQVREQKEAAAAPPLAADPTQPPQTAGSQGEDPAANLDLIWDHFSKSLASGNSEMLAFLTGSREGSQPEAPHELDLILRIVIPKASPHSRLTAPRREIVVQASSSDPVEKRLTSVVEWVRGHLGHVNLVLMIELCSTSVSSPTSEVLSLGKFAPWKFVTFGDIFGHYSWLGDGDATAIEWVETEKLLDILQRVAPTIRAVQPDVPSGTATFLPLEEDVEGSVEVQMSNVYQVQLQHSEGKWFISVLIFCPERWHSEGVIYPKLTWLAEELLAKLARWSVENKKSEFKNTLSLISVMRYSRTYQELKEKYKEMVKVWPEVTDPEKFVYEDVAIATYLLILWEEERAERGVTAKQSFVDLGCGNGLLVHILCSEGHPGRGIDVRRRKIWDMYGPQTQLEEGAITPGDKTLFPDADWLIGNHSDELTPWIPVITARSSYNCRFFVLPCCFFDFTGKYCRRQSRKTQYREYLDFIQEVGLSCGFHVQEDCLRIPSTKRVCLIGKSRTYPPTGEVWMDEQRARYIHGRRGHPVSPPGKEHSCSAPEVAAGSAGHQDSPASLGSGTECVPEALPAEQGAGTQAAAVWLPGFQPREKAEPVRNCATLPRDFVDQVVLQVADLLLAGKKLNTASSQEGSLKTWNGGGSYSLAEVASELDRETLRRLKRECGGLQTLLRNSHQVFKVLNGRVHIRDWRQELQKEKRPAAKRSLSSEAFKTRLCWFFTHHPDGCVLPSSCCPFAHGPGELQPSQTSQKQRQST